MGRQAKPKPDSKKAGFNAERKCGKKPKQHPKVIRATGKTKGGYSPARISAREHQRTLWFDGLLSALNKKVAA